MIRSSSTPRGLKRPRSDPSAQEEMEIEGDEPEAAGSGGAAADQEQPEAPNARRRFLPSSVGLTVLLPPDVNESRGARLLG